MFNPFLDKEGIIQFKYKPTRDIVFVLPSRCPENLGSIIIPEMYRENYRNEYGIVLAVGKGCYIKRFKKYVPTIVKPGQIVIYDPQTIHGLEVEALDGNMYYVKILGERDLSGILNQ